MYSHELYHHGILGQKWGHRYGPPYPLSGSKHSALEKKKGWKKSINDPDSAKGYAKRLNKYDKDKAKYAYNTFKAKRAANEYDKRMHKALQKGKTVQAEKNKIKRDRELAKHKDQIEFNERQVKAIKKETSRLLKDAKRKGYTINSKATIRRIRDGQDHVTNLLALGAGAMFLYATPATLVIVPQTGGAVPGIKYKAGKG